MNWLVFRRLVLCSHHLTGFIGLIQSESIIAFGASVLENSLAFVALFIKAFRHAVAHAGRIHNKVVKRKALRVILVITFLDALHTRLALFSIRGERKTIGASIAFFIAESE